MHRRTLLAAAGASVVAMPAAPRAQSGIVLSLAWSHPHLYRDALEAILRLFHARHPGVEVRPRGASDNYDVLLQTVLRDAAVGAGPDLGFFGLQHVRILAERGLSQPLDALVGEPGFAASGRGPAAALGRFGGRQHALGYSLSVPTIFFNAELLRRAGGDPDALPADWEAMIAVATRLNGLGGGIQSGFLEHPGNDWYFQNLVHGAGGRMLTADERRVAFDGAEGLAAMRVFHRLAREGGMPALGRLQAVPPFLAGRMGFYANSTSYIRNLTRDVAGRFPLRALVLPRLSAEGRLCPGGAGIVQLARDPARAEAARRFVLFVTSAEAQAVMARTTGYAPTNSLSEEALADHYAASPMHRTASEHLHLLTDWYAYPGPNAPRMGRITSDRVDEVVSLRRGPEEALRDLARDVQALLPA